MGENRLPESTLVEQCDPGRKPARANSSRGLAGEDTGGCNHGRAAGGDCRILQCLGQRGVEMTDIVLNRNVRGRMPQQRCDRPDVMARGAGFQGAWADMLDTWNKGGDNVTPIKRSAA